MSKLLVNRCICHDKTFTEIQEYVEQEGINEVAELQAEDYCSNNCRMCEPYLELMFETGETAFEPGAYLKVNSK
ncbi:MAG: hypothetical protein BalsKO_09100 [Balneolaceae bacterium]